MRFTTAWAEVSSQNVTLKVAVSALTFLSIAMGVSLVRLSLRDPIIIERACFSKTISKSNATHSEKEIAAFLEDALRQRFNSDIVPTASYLSSSEEEFRRQDQEKLKNSQMTQKVSVNSVKTEKDRTLVDADRIISVGSIRSAFSFPLEVTLASTTRHESNPYGLQLIKVTPLQKSDPTPSQK